jgi:ribosomal protein L11 methyltransferase
MREVVLHVPRRAVEEVLDRLLPMLPGGVHERERKKVTELRIRGTDLPSLDEILALSGRRDLRAWEHEVSDDWRERRADDYVPDVIGGRLVVAPDWAPASGAELEIVLDQSTAFGSGDHPTTRRCMELLLELSPDGSFADLGCGTGVLGILAARLGFDPVVVVDVSPESVDAALANAATNGAQLRGVVMDLLTDDPPVADVFVANVPPAIHLSLAEKLPDPFPRLGVLSGFHPGAAAAVLSAYEARGAEMKLRQDVHGWAVAVVAGPLPEATS